MAAGGQSEMRVTLKIVWANIVTDFPARKPVWAMTALNMIVGLILTINPGAFTSNPGASIFFARLLEIAPTEFWRQVFIISSTARFFTLVINGTFKDFSHSALIRAAMSAVSAMIWGQIAASILGTTILSIGGAAFAAFVICEIENVRTAVIDARAVHADGRRRRD